MICKSKALVNINCTKVEKFNFQILRNHFSILSRNKKISISIESSLGFFFI